MAAALLGLLLALGAAAPGAAAVKRYEVVGSLALDPAAPDPAPRQAALRDALGEAVVRATADVLREVEPGGEPAGDAEAPPPAPPPGEPTEYAVSYRVLEDRGEQASLVSGAPAGGREYVVVAEVQIDLDRLRDALRRQGRLGGAAAGGPASFELEILDIPSPAAWTSIRGALVRAGAESVVPLELQPGRARIQVRAPAGAAFTVARLAQAELPAGLRLESLPPEPGGPPRLRVQTAPPAPGEPEGRIGEPEAASPPEAAPGASDD
jgi:hypothetical protein